MARRSLVTKECRRCFECKPLSEFRPKAAASDGLQTWCIDCQKEYHRERYQTNVKYRQGMTDASSRWKAANYESVLLHAARKRSKAAGLPCNLTVEDIIIPDVCPVLGIPIERGVGKMGENSPSLDRIVPELGYVKGNVYVISMRANRLKSDASLGELEAILAYMKLHLSTDTVNA